MERNSEPAAARKLLRGGAGLIVAAALVFILLVWLPAYRWSFLGSLGIGVVVAAILYFWNKYRPVKEEDVQNKRPLGLQQAQPRKLCGPLARDRAGGTPALPRTPLATSAVRRHTGLCVF